MNDTYIYAELVKIEADHWIFETSEGRTIKISKEWRGWRDWSEQLVIGENYTIKTSHDKCCSWEGKKHYINEGHIVGIDGKGRGEFSPYHPIWILQLKKEAEWLRRDKRELEEKNRVLEERCKDYDKLERELRNLRDEKDEGIKDLREKLETEQREKRELENKIARLEEKSGNDDTQKVKLEKELKDEKTENNKLYIKLDEKSNQLITLRIENNNKDNELHQKNEEIERLKKLAKSHDKRAEKSQEELLTEKLRSEKGNLELLANELKINLEQIHSLTKYHERLFVARKNHSQANIDIHEANIAKVKQELTDQEISVVHIQEICRKCEKIAELLWELEQSQQQFETRQEVPTNH